MKDLSQQVQETLLWLNGLFAVVYSCAAAFEMFTWKLHSATVMETLVVLSTLVTLKYLLRTAFKTEISLAG